MTDHTHPSGAPWRNFYGRFKGKGLRKAQENALQKDLDALSPGAVSWEDNPDRVPLDLEQLCRGRALWLEVGFGGGEHLVHQAQANPSVHIIGCEPYINGVAMLLRKIQAADISNLSVYPGDARHLFDVLPDQSVDRAFLLYPDPWPKKRHHRRRFVTADHLRPLYKRMAPGSIFRVATDIPDYVRQTLIEASQAGFHWTATCPNDWRQPWDDWISTRSEQQALREDRVPHYLTFRRGE